MITAKVIYQGDLRTHSTHIRSGQTVITDAPLDNQGKGEAFSPTDLVSSALGSCMLTLMGIAARTHHINMDGTTAEVIKHMAENPRRIARIEVKLTMKGGPFDDKQKQILERAALTCPVSKSLSAELVQDVTFDYAS